MDTTAIEYEVKELRGLVDALMEERYQRIKREQVNYWKDCLDNPNILCRGCGKTYIANSAEIIKEHQAHCRPKAPTKPKFWKQWVVRGLRTIEPTSFWQEGQLLREKSEPVYCFTREMLVIAFSKMKDEYLRSPNGIRVVVDNYLKSEGEA